MKVPEELSYTKEHEWIQATDNEATIGITDFAQSQLGDIIFLELPEIGDKVIAGEPFGEIEAVKTVSDLFMPINGEVLEFNENLEDNPELINSDPYGDGWIIKISISDLTELDDLLTSESYQKLVD